MLLNTALMAFSNYENAHEALDIFNQRIELGGKISFPYIDGNHKYDPISRDFINYDFLS